MISYPPALRRTGFVAPRAIGRMGVAVMEARAAGASPPPPHVEMSRPAHPWVDPHHQPRRVVIRLWLPLTVLFLLLSPFALLLTPLLYFAPPPYGDRPLKTVLGIGAVLMSLSGTDVDVDTRDARVHIKIV
jgi:hypothetical protein